MGFLRSWFDPLGITDSGSSLREGLAGGGGTQAGIETKIISDPYKTAVSSPLSKFLASKVGTGIGEYPTDPNYTARYNDYMKVNPQQYFDQNIAQPAHENFNKYAVPLISEGFAGNLRGSGHYGAQESGQVQLQDSLDSTASTFIPNFSKSQIDVGQSEFQRSYGNWYNSLPETNPVLKSSIDFLNSDSGYNILSALNPGQKGWFGDLLNTLGTFGGAFLGATL